MPRQVFRLAEILAALSHALDLTEGQPKGHCVRCCWIGVKMGEALNLTPQEISGLYYTLLLKDLGCSSNAARICQLYLADDLTFKKDFKRIDGSLPQALRFVLGHTGLEKGLAERFRAIVNILKNGGEISRELIEARCHRGAEIASQMRFSEDVCAGIENLDEHWDGSGKPMGKTGRSIPIFSQIALMAQVADVFHVAGGPELAMKEIRNRAGSWFEPGLISIFEAIASDEEFWQVLASPGLVDRVLTLEPAQATRTADEDYVDDIATAFAKVIDSKSPFTNGHSQRVSVFTDLVAEELGCDAPHRRMLRRAALLHDIGKLAVSNAILDKPGKLTTEEFAAVKLHPVHSGEILRGVSLFAEIAPIAEGHHERLDGKGYPHGLSAKHIGRDTRIVTVADIFDALTADRPYRKAMTVSQALEIMENDVGTAIDGDCLQALKRALVRAERAAA